jgi:hypothetical protein
MHHRHLKSLTAIAFLMAATQIPAIAQNQPQRPAQAQQPQRGPQQNPAGPRQQQQPPPPAAAAPYQAVAVSAPQPLKDPSFEALRQQLGEIAERKDRAGLARLIVAQGFFWMGEKGDKANKRRPGIDNLATALALNAKDGSGWEALASYATDPTAAPLPDRKDVMCGPAEPAFDAKALENLTQQSRTDISEWGYPVRPGLEVRAAAQPTAPVIETLGLHFVRVLPDAGPSNEQAPMLRVVTPAGKTGFVSAEALLPLGNDQLCYVKDSTGWKITGFIGGNP